MTFENITSPGFTQTQKFYLVAFRVFVSFLSLLGSLFIMMSIVMFKKIQHMSFRLIFQLTFASFLESIANLVTVAALIYLLVPGLEDPLRHGPLCDFQGTLLQLSQIATFGWITAIAINLYLVVAQGKSQNEYEVYYNACVWLSAVALTLVPLSTPFAYGQAGSWCWLTLEEGQIYRWWTFYAPLLLVSLVVTVLYVKIARAVKHKLHEGTEQSISDTKLRLDRLNIRLRAYPLVLISLYIFPLINRGYEAITKQYLFPLAMIQVLTAPALGFANAIVYGMDIEMRYMWAQLLTKYCCCTSSCCTLVYEYKETSEEDVHFWDENTPLIDSSFNDYNSKGNDFINNNKVREIVI